MPTRKGAYRPLGFHSGRDKYMRGAKATSSIPVAKVVELMLAPGIGAQRLDSVSVECSTSASYTCLGLRHAMIA